jgi:Na+-driven multidrug efflux pump
LLILLRESWARLFSSDEEVIRIVANVVRFYQNSGVIVGAGQLSQIPLVGMFQILDAVTGAATGILRGAGLGIEISILITCCEADFFDS